MRHQPPLGSHSRHYALLSGVTLAVFTLLFALLITGCTGESGGNVQTVPQGPTSPAPASTPTEIVSAEWTREPTPPLMDQVWQPPQPKKRAQFTPPTEVTAGSDAMITYELVGLGVSADMKITSDGEVSVFGYRETVWTLQLPPERFQSLLEKFDQARFFDLNNRYIEDDPPGVIGEMSYVTVTYTKDGRTKSVETRGSSLTPPAYIEVEKALRELVQEVRDNGTLSKRPDPLVDYMLLGGDYSWTFDVDIEGGLYYGSGHVDAHLSADDLKSLRDALTEMRGLPADHWYMPSKEVRDILFMSEHRVIVSTYENGERRQNIQGFSGASIPAEYQAVLEKLAEIYDKYAP